MLKILQAIPYYIRATNTGGPAPVAHRLSRALSSYASVKVLSTNGDLNQDIVCPLNVDVEEQGVSVHYLKRSARWVPPTYYYAPKLNGWLESNLQNFNLVVIHGIWTYFSLRVPRLCRRLGVPYLYFLHGSLDPWALKHRGYKKLPYWNLMEKNLFRYAAGFIALSESEGSQLRAMNYEQPVFIARNGLEFPLQRIPSHTEIVNNKWPELTGHKYVLFLSRLHPKKGLEILIESWARVKEEHSDWRLLLAGPDEEGYLTKLQKMVTSLGLEKDVHFLGLVTGELKAALFQSASIFVLPSFSEGVPTAVIEAMGYGLPVVVTPGCHLPEVNNSNAGLEVEPTLVGVTNGLLTLIENSAMRQEMGQNAEKLAQSEFDEQKVAEDLVEYCKEVLAASKM